MRILVVEDEYSLADLVASRLKKEKYTVDTSFDGEEGLYNALTDIYDLIILDIMLPKLNGIDILKEIRNKNIKAKVLMLTAKAELDDKLLGFNSGANDYLTKPFHMDELVARVNALLRINVIDNKDYIEFGDVIINGGTINITGQSSFDYDGKAEFNGGTITVNGQEITTIPNQIMGGGNRPQQGGMQPPEQGSMPQEPQRGGRQNRY